ncbi:MAG TPA: ATP-binding protein, partial [Sedimentisphaerales bacterium]
APEYGRVSQQWIIRISRPLRKKDGTFAGVLAASYKISHFLALLEKLNIRDIGFVGLVGRDGIVRVQSYGGKLSYGGKVPANSAVFKRILSGEKQGAFDELSRSDQKRRIGYFATSEVLPFHVYVGYDYSQIEMDCRKVVLLLGVIWILFSAIVFGVVLFSERLANAHEQSRIAAIESLALERKRILSDMHDSIGASLAVLISHLNPGGGDWDRLRRKATQILTELRLLVDSVGGQDAGINAVLASVRHRMQSGLELAGIKVIWRVDQLPEIINLTPNDALSLRLILMEALSNVIHHSRANTVTLSAIYDKASRLLAIAVSDDGCGLVATPSSEGFGLKSMKARAKKLTWPTTIHIESELGKGTTVQIKMELPADLITTD